MNGDALKRKALALHQASGDSTSFTASDGWLRKFKKRHGISHRKITGCAQKVPEHANMLATVFYSDVKKAIDTYGKWTSISIYNPYSIDKTEWWICPAMI